MQDPEKMRNRAEDAIGNTPLVRLERLERENGLYAQLYVKLEGCNLAGSVKDRVARALLDSAEAKGLLLPGSTVIEPTSGNTGIGLAAVGIPRGYRVVLVMPETMSAERRSLLRAYGAELVLTEGALGMAGSIQRAKKMTEDTPGAYMPNQFSNPAAAQAHYDTTGPEIWADTAGGADIFVAGVGTGGTVTGVGRFLKEKKPGVQVVAVEPFSSPVISGGKAGAHGIQGIGAGFVPDVLDVGLLDEVIAVQDRDAFATGRALARRDGILAGVSSGAALWAALLVAARPENAGKKLVVLLADTGERYLSTPMYAE